MTQKATILKHLKKRPATNIELTTKYWIGCPWKRIAELEEDGHQIFREKVEKNGKLYVRYHMASSLRAVA